MRELFAFSFRGLSVNKMMRSFDFADLSLMKVIAETWGWEIWRLLYQEKN